MWAGQQRGGGMAGSVDASAAGRLPQAAGCQSDRDIHSHTGLEPFTRLLLHSALCRDADTRMQSNLSI